MVMNWLDVFLVALSLVALRKAQTKPTGPPAFRNSSESNTTAEPTVEPWRLRLMDGGSSCSGRVELEYHGAWGTVCDDNWDLADAEVVCQQLGCGWAIQAVNASHFQKGTGPIHLDEVKCLGNESYLWNCPSEENQDCGHKEDAGVICSEHQEWRLSGGLDACAGRVEVYYHGIWNTVCDGSWYQDEADVLCRSLGCSDKASVSRVAFNHTLLGKMFYQCLGSEDSLASCDWRYNRASLCEQFRAAGVICNGSPGLVGSTDTPGPETVTPTSYLSSPSWSTPESWEPTPPYQMLQILCIVLGILLFLVTLTLIITLKWRRKNGTLDCALSSGSAAAPALVNHSVQITATEARRDYREIPTSLPKEEVRPVPVSEDSDSDYEHYDFNHKPPVALSTFYNSLRHRAANEDGIAPAPPAEHGTGHLAFESDPYGAQPAAEDSDSTSSGDAEWYENIQKPEQQKGHPGNETSFEGVTTFSGPLVDCEVGPATGSFDSSDYDDTWS